MGEACSLMRVRKQRDRETKRLLLSILFKNHPCEYLQTFKAPSLKGCITSRPPVATHSGNKTFNSWSFWGHSRSKLLQDSWERLCCLISVFQFQLSLTGSTAPTYPLSCLKMSAGKRLGERVGSCLQSKCRVIKSLKPVLGS